MAHQPGFNPRIGRRVTAALDAAVDTGGSRLVVDLTGVTFLGVVGAEALRRTAVRCRSRDVALALTGVRARMLRTLTLCGRTP